ncbi:MAG: peptidoglycan DD-metalloendopeptidase family protein [Rikenellaceae bacterium]
MNNIMRWILAFVALVLFVGCIDRSYDNSQVEAEVDSLPIAPIERRYGVPIEGYRLERNKVRSGQTMGDIMRSYGKSALDIDRLSKASDSIFSLRKIRAGFDYTAFIEDDSLEQGRLDYIAYEQSAEDYVLFSMVGDSVVVTTGSKPTITVRNKRAVVINTSLWGAIMQQDLPYALAMDLEDIYQWSIDFFGIQGGDSFTVIYDERFVEDTISVGISQIWGAKFSHSSKDYYAIPFNQNGRIEYWDEEGASLKKQMLKAPLKYSRISSTFSNARLHPIYKVYRPHHGVDYAAPSGTPVHSVADGVVTFKGWGGGGGNMLKIQHPNKIMTGYLHLSRFASGINQGTRVQQGQLIGYVGSTGASTGPHLDYRVWKGGTAINPLTVPQEPTEPISKKNERSYDIVKESIILELNGIISDDKIIRDTALLRPAIDSIVVTDNGE